MPCPKNVRLRCTWRSAVHLVLSALVITGCQSYEPVPLDIPAYRARLDARLTNPEPVIEFVRRLDARGEDVPERLDFEDGITCSEGEVLALFYNPDLRIARLEAGVALATKETAGLWEDPVFGFDGAEIVSPPTPFEYGFMFSFTVPISGRLEIEKERAGAAYEAELRAVVDLEWRTRANVRRLWAVWAASVAQSELLEQLIEDITEINGAADRLEEVGEINRVERRLLTISLADLEIQASELELKLINSEIALLETLGLPPEASSLLIATFPESTVPEVEDIADRLLRANTTLAVHFARYRVAEQTLRLEVRKQFPDIILGTGYGTQFNDHRVMFGVAIPIPILNANRAAIAEAHAHRNVVRAEAETTFARLQRMLAGATAALELKRIQRDRYEDHILPLLSEQSRDIQAIAELGELDMFVLLETVTKTLHAKQRMLNLHVEELDAAITVHRILGPEPRTDDAMVSTDTAIAGGTQ